MPGIKRPTIKPDVRPISTLLDDLLGAVVTRLAQGLKRPKPELIDVAVVRLDVVTDDRRLNDAAFEAERAKRVR